NPEDVESARPFVEGFIVKEYWERPSNWRARQTLADYLRAHKIPGIQGIDTRALVRHIRTHGAQEAVISTVDLDPKSLTGKARRWPSLIGRDLVKQVTCAEPYDWDEATWSLQRGYQRPATRDQRQSFVVAYDFGIKRNILRNLVRSGCRVRVVPAA